MMGLGSSQPGPHPASATEVIETALLLRQLSVPADLIPYILDLAEYWAPVATASRSDEVKVMESSGSGRAYLSLSLPPWLPPRRVRRIRFTMQSKDQGWSSYPEDHGTYRGSWTWWEVCVVRRDRQTAMPAHDTLSMRWIMDEEPGCMSPEARLWRKRLQFNVHAGPEYQTHVVEWVNSDAPPPRSMQSINARNDDSIDSSNTPILNSVGNDATEEHGDQESQEDYAIREMMWDLKANDMIALTTWARFAGWMNQIKNASVEIDAAVVRRM